MDAIIAQNPENAHGVELNGAAAPVPAPATDGLTLDDLVNTGGDAPAGDDAPADTEELTLTVANMDTWPCPAKDADGNSYTQTIYRMFFKESFNGLVKVNGEKVSAQVNYIDFRPGELIDILSDFVPNFAIVVLDKREAYRRGIGSTMNAAGILKYFMGATVMVTREFHAAGEPYTRADGSDGVYAMDTYLTYVDDVTLSATGSKRLDRAVDAI